MCGRYASSRRPEDLIEEFEVEESRIPAALEPDYNVAPTKEVYAVVERPPDREKASRPQRQLRVLRWGLIPSWAKDAAIGNRMINARMETVAEKPAFRRAFASRRCLLPADGYFEWYPTEELTRRASRRSSRSSSAPDGGVLAMAGLYEIWRDPDRDEDDPERFRWTCTVLTTPGRGRLGHIHDRMPLMVPADRWSAWLDPGAAEGRDRLALLEPAAPGLLEAFPVSTDGGQRPQQRSRAGRAAPARLTRRTARIGDNGPMSDVRTIPTPHGDARLVTSPFAPAPDRDAAGQPRRGGRHRHPRPRGAGVRAARTGHHRAPSRAAVAGGRHARSPPRPPTLDDALRLRRRLDPAAHPARGRRTLRRCTLGGPHRDVPRRLRGAGAVVPAAPAGPPGEVAGRRAHRGRRAGAGRSRASATRWAVPRSSPRAPSWSSYPSADHGLKVPKSAPLTQDDVAAIDRRGDAGVDRPRGHRRLTRRDRESSRAPVVFWETCQP